jgi:hypothetical protein
MLATTLAAVAQEAPVTITGGADATGHIYEWKVTNRHTSPIVFLEFPQYRGDTFTAPDGWTQDWKYRAMAGGTVKPGWVRASVADGGMGIQPGSSNTFRLRIARGGAERHTGSVTVRFADRTEVLVGNVEVPTRQSFLKRHVALIGLVIIVAVALSIHLWRRRKHVRATPPSEPAGENGTS